jgi:diketogulonate reductase-like aldo/keto reductase
MAAMIAPQINGKAPSSAAPVPHVNGKGYPTVNGKSEAGNKAFTLRSGDKVPAIGMGTFTGTRLTQKAEKEGPGGTMEENIKTWIKIGGRMIDAAQNYLNEAEIGDAIHACIKEGIVTREELFVSSKLNNPYHHPYDAARALRKTLKDLRLDYLDMYLMHWPVPFVPVPFEADPRYPDGRGHGPNYEPDQCSKVTGKLWSETHWDKTGEFPPHLQTGVSVHETWKAMIILKEAGLVRNIGVCNMNVQLLNELCIVNPEHLPSILQCESHPYCQQTGLIRYCKKMGIQFQGFSPLGYGEFRKGHEIAPMKDPVILAIAEKHGVSAAQVCLRWTNQRGVATMPFSLKQNEMEQNLDIWKFTLTDEDMEQMATLDKGLHYLRPDDWFGLPLWD